MKIDKRIILYLDNQMNIEESKMFEAELNYSSELSNQLECYKNILQSLKSVENKSANEDYFFNLVPKFRQNLSTGKKAFQIKTAYALTAVASVFVIFLLIFNPFKASENNSLAKLISTLDENEASQIFNYYSDNFSSANLEPLNGSSDSLFTDLISSELNLQESDLSQLVSFDGIDIEKIYSEIKTDEADLIYNKILKTKYF
jgi:hypothetical protein